MEEYTWKNLFENAIRDQGIYNVWKFSVDDHLQAQQGYLQFPQSTYASFQCSYCGRRWNSAQVHILFLIKWDRNSRCGTVKMRIFRQQCRRCNVSKFQNPEITNVNIERAIMNLVSKIQSMVLGQRNTKPLLGPEVYSDDVDGPHDKEHCEACKLQMCPWNPLLVDQTSVAKPQSVKVHSWIDSSTPVQQSPNEKIIVAIILIIIFLLFSLTTIPQK